MLTVSSFRNRYLEFLSALEYSDTRIQLFLDDAALVMDEPSKWLDFYNIAQAALAAHLLTINMNSKEGDSSLNLPISSQTVDDVSLSFAVKPMDVTDIDYLTTSYGQTYYGYLRMITTTVVGI